MKKILYLFLLSLVVVSCDKDDDMTAISYINPMEQDVQLGLSNDQILELVGNVMDMNIKKGSKKGAKGLTSKGTDRISMHLFLSNEIIYATYLDESNDDLCIEADDATFLSTVHLNNQNGQIEVTLGEEAAVLSTVAGDFSTLFGLPLNVLLKLDGGTVIGQALFNDDNTASF